MKIKIDEEPINDNWLRELSNMKEITLDISDESADWIKKAPKMDINKPSAKSKEIPNAPLKLSHVQLNNLTDKDYQDRLDEKKKIADERVKI